MRNKHGGNCYRCGKWCDPGAGHFELFRGGWRVQHAMCAIEYRGTPDADRQSDRLKLLKHRAKLTGRQAQRARRELRSLGVKTKETPS